MDTRKVEVIFNTTKCFAIKHYVRATLNTHIPSLNRQRKSSWEVFGILSKIPATLKVQKNHDSAKDHLPLPENHIPPPLVPWTLTTINRTHFDMKIHISTPSKTTKTQHVPSKTTTTPHTDYTWTLQLFKHSEHLQTTNTSTTSSSSDFQTVYNEWTKIPFHLSVSIIFHMLPYHFKCYLWAFTHFQPFQEKFLPC